MASLRCEGLRPVGPPLDPFGNASISFSTSHSVKDCADGICSGGLTGSPWGCLAARRFAVLMSMEAFKHLSAADKLPSCS